MIGTSSRFMVDGMRHDPFNSVQPSSPVGAADGASLSPAGAGAGAGFGAADATLGEASAKTAESPLIRDHMRPGPGAYNLNGSLGQQPLSTVKTSYGYSMGKSQRPDPTGVGNLKKKQRSPGPGSYNLSSGYGASPNSQVKTAPMCKFGTAVSTGCSVYLSQ